MQKISFIIFLFAALCLTGCNFNESNSDSKDIEKFLLLQNNSLRITDLSISQSTILTYDESDTVAVVPFTVVLISPFSCAAYTVLLSPISKVKG